MPQIPRGVAPSILSADFARLGEQVDLVLEAGARSIHFDVMDGHFVPPITVGPDVAKAIVPRIHAAGAILDVHLMVERPERHIDAFAEAGADRILVQVESTPNVHYAVKRIREQDEAFREITRARSTMHGNVVVTDFRPLAEMPVGNRFLVYTLFPQANISIRSGVPCSRKRWKVKPTTTCATTTSAVIQ